MIATDNPNFSSENFSLTAEGGKNFFRYLKNFNLFSEPEIFILSPNIHFYYDENDFINIKTFVILKKLNLIKDLDTFLHTVSIILPDNVNFIGCFSDSDSSGVEEFIPNLVTRFNNFLDSRTDHSLDRKVVSKLLEKHGFQVVDMSEINKLTFFYSKHIRQSIEIKT
jgi:hypothetical protein